MPNTVPTAVLSMTGQSIWLDNITRAMLGGQLQKYIAEWSVVGLTSNPTIFAKAISGSKDYDAQVAELSAKGMKEEDVFFAVAIDDLSRACDLFAGVHARTGGVDGWCSLEVSPLLAYDATSTVEQAVALHARAAKPNLFIKVPGTAAGLPAIEELTFRGIPINVTLLFDTAHYLAAADAYLRGLERRVAAGKSPVVAGVASLFISRWDATLDAKLPANLKNRVGRRSVPTRTRRTWSCIRRRAGWRCRRRARVRSGSSTRAPAPRTRSSRRRSTWRASLRRSRSTPCPRQRCRRSTRTVP